MRLIQKTEKVKLLVRTQNLQGFVTLSLVCPEASKGRRTVNTYPCLGNYLLSALKGLTNPKAYV